MLRAACRSGTELGKKIRVLMDRGELVSDEIVIAIIAQRLDQPDCVSGAVFDGFPRTIAQAKALDEMLERRGRPIELVIELKVKDESLVGRVEQRIREGGALRGDDTPHTLRHRLKVYYDSTAPLLDYFREQGKLASVDGMAPIGDVAGAITVLLEAVGERGGKDTAAAKSGRNSDVHTG